MARVSLSTVALLFVLAAPFVRSGDKTPIPKNKSQVEAWFNANVKKLAERKGALDPALEAAEGKPRVIKVKKDGSGEFKTLTDAIKSVPTENKQRVIISLGPGEYKEKVTIERSKPFITLYGEGNAKPNLTFDGTAAQYGTVDSATLIVESDYFMAANIRVLNSAPMPDGQRKGAQALAVRVSGDKAAFYNCEFYGFQDTVCDDKGSHFFKDCFIQGTYDFIFGSGTSLYLGTRLNVVGDGLRVITAHAGKSEFEKSGYSFVHGSITGVGNGVYLGRAWMSHPKVVYAYTEMTNVVDPTGWSKNLQPARDKTVFYGEYKCSGAGSHQANRVDYAQQLSAKEAEPFLSLGYIQASKWLLPPPKV